MDGTAAEVAQLLRTMIDFLDQADDLGELRRMALELDQLSDEADLAAYRVDLRLHP